MTGNGKKKSLTTSFLESSDPSLPVYEPSRTSGLTATTIASA